jgi:hypothetical protein
VLIYYMARRELLNKLKNELAAQRLANSSFSILAAAIKAASIGGARQ